MVCAQTPGQGAALDVSREVFTCALAARRAVAREKDVQVRRQPVWVAREFRANSRRRAGEQLETSRFMKFMRGIRESRGVGYVLRYEMVRCAHGWPKRVGSIVPKGAGLRERECGCAFASFVRHRPR